MKFYKPVEGRIVRRFGTDAHLAARMQFEPAKRAGQPPRAMGYVQDLTRVVKVTDLEFRKFRREYLNCVRHGDLTEATVEDFNAWAAAAGEPLIPVSSPAPVSAPNPPSEPAKASSEADKALDGDSPKESEPKKVTRRRKRVRKA